MKNERKNVGEIDPWCQFHQHLYVQIFCTNVVSAAISSYMYVVKAAETTFVRKIHIFNIDEIDTSEKSSEILTFLTNINISPNISKYFWVLADFRWKDGDGVKK
jgi:hypothetical protein